MGKYSFFRKQVKYDFLIFFREPLFAFPILFIPAFFFIVFTSMYASYGDVRSFQQYVPIYSILISFLTIFFNIGMQSVADRELGVYKRIIISPTNIYFIVATYIVRGVVISFVGLIEMLLIANLGFGIPISDNLFVFILVFLIMIGIMLLMSLTLHGFFKNSRQVVPFTVLVFQYVLFASGLMFPVERLSKALQYFVFANPVYHMDRIAISIWENKVPNVANILALVVTIVICILLLLVQKNRQEY
ncbi:ABC transporter permease [Caloranaerobacter sp. DY30410]|uniref:ABC transporter permease n=1 Tax=Caloranaerobacter sp. DY30410 TaxID=3238305 RepID=UPI003D03A792